MRINYINTIWIVTLLACPSALCRLVLLLWLVRRDGVVNLLQLPQVNVASCFFCYSRCYGNEKTILKDSVPVNHTDAILLITGQPSYEIAHYWLDTSLAMKIAHYWLDTRLAVRKIEC